MQNKNYLLEGLTSVEKGRNPLHLKSFNEYLESRSYLYGYTPTTIDFEFRNVFKTITININPYRHIRRWFNHICTYTDDERKKFDSTNGNSINDLLQYLLDAQVTIIFYRCFLISI